jgi:type II secretory pathway pseudopilin PulG
MELVVVVFIIALLAAIAQPNLHRALVKARATQAVQDLQVVRVAVLNYHANYHVYPPDVNRGQVPPGLGPYLPENWSLTQKYFTIDYDNWSTKSEGFVGVTVITPDAEIGAEMVSMLGPNAWTDGSQKFTWVIEWNN